MTMKSGNLHLDDSAAQEGRRVANLESPQSSHEIWYETRSRPLSIASGADPFLAGSILHWMKLGVDLHVHGSVSRTLLRGLSEWQQAWSRWRPDLYRQIDISADEIRDDVPTGENAIAAFSGGVGQLAVGRRRRPRRLTWWARCQSWVPPGRWRRARTSCRTDIGFSGGTCTWEISGCGLAGLVLAEQHLGGASPPATGR